MKKALSNVIGNVMAGVVILVLVAGAIYLVAGPKYHPHPGTVVQCTLHDQDPACTGGINTNEPDPNGQYP
jgi:hypothetical protein